MAVDKDTAERIATIETDVRWIREKLDKIDCGTHAERISAIDMRCTSVEKSIIWGRRFAISTLVTAIIAIFAGMVKFIFPK